MKKLSLLALASLTMVGAASAQTKAKTPATKAPTAMACAVTKEKLDVVKATKDHMYADYKGRRYFFCCAGCPEQFKKDPAKFAKTAPSIVTPKEGKK